MKRSTPLFAALLLATAAPGHADTTPTPGPSDPRIRLVSYDPDDVVRLHGYVGYQIHIEWAAGEHFIDLGAGDTGGFDVGTVQNHFFIKPKQEHVNTDITVLTNRHTYHYDYRVSPPPSRRHPPADLIYSIRYRYPADEARRQSAQAARLQAEQRRQAEIAARPHHTDYWYCGSPSLRPAGAYDDGLQTHLRFPANGELPAVFVLNDDDSESLVNAHIEQDELVVHRVARRLVLRRGDLTGCIVNKSLADTAHAQATAMSDGPRGDQP